MKSKEYEEGYAFCYDGFKLNQCSYSQSSDEFADFMLGHEAAEREIQQDYDCADHDQDDGGWTREDEESMTRGRDLPLRNEAGEYF